MSQSPTRLRFQVPVSQTALLSMIDMAGKINLFLDPNGVGERQEIGRGAIFGEKHFRRGRTGTPLMRQPAA